jgi:hypothetical protein
VWSGEAGLRARLSSFRAGPIRPGPSGYESGIEGDRTPAQAEKGQESGGIVSDLKGVPADIRDATESADRRLREATEEQHTMRAALDWRTVALAFAAALLLAILFRLVFSPMIAVVAFLVLFGVGWYVVARIRRTPPPREEHDGEEDENREGDENRARDGEGDENRSRDGEDDENRSRDAGDETQERDAKA